MFDIYTELFVGKNAEARQGDDSVMEFDITSFSHLYKNLRFAKVVLDQVCANSSYHQDATEMWHLKVVFIFPGEVEKRSSEWPDARRHVHNLLQGFHKSEFCGKDKQEDHESIDHCITHHPLILTLARFGS